MCRNIINSSCTDYVETLDNEKENLPKPPDRVPCSVCGIPQETCYVRNVKWYSLCWIPLMPIWHGDSYLACRGCNNKLANLKRMACSNCRMTVPYGFKHCCDCGNEIK
ncbi:hypothetical protein TUBRATIS_23690 [Tubulinosema ratisbonensis]|uniref:Zinc-ribbon 15 domain-containing protein n=1 Tax=Tubulinosema ratisbonensis TaxID=291195 RepID=A0A437AJD7_9MICR|nr:hypothetical protein TUBRATIS_23690 [Tubulinosema ratisbonensis]